MAQYSFLESIPPTFEYKLISHKQRFGKITITVVSDKDENLLWSRLQWHRSCHSNEMTLLPILLAAVFLGTGNCSSKIIYGSFFLQYLPRYSWSLSEICKSVIEIFLDKVFMVRNMIKRNGQSWYSAVKCRKRSAFDVRFHLIVVSIFLKTCVNNSSSRLLERRIWLVCIWALLLVASHAGVSRGAHFSSFPKTPALPENNIPFPLF